MKIDQLAYFAEAARHEHVGKAARALHISPSAISHSIRGLEEELGTELFEKVGRAIRLTEAGKRLAERAGRVLREVESLRTEMRADGRSWEGHCRVGLTHGLGEKVFLPWWNAFQKKHPRLVLESYSLRSAEILRAVGAGELDFGICFAALESPRLERRVLRTEEMRLVVRKGHPLLKLPASRRAEAIGKFPNASPKAFQGLEVCERHPELVRRKIEPRVDFIFDSYPQAAERLRSTDSWALLPESFAREPGIVPLDLPGWSAQTSITAIWPKDRRLGRPFTAFLESVKTR